MIYLFMFQVRFVKNVTVWKEMKPAFYHGHVSFLDFSKYVLCAPVIVSLFRFPQSVVVDVFCMINAV